MYGQCEAPEAATRRHLRVSSLTVKNWHATWRLGVLHLRCRVRLRHRKVFPEFGLIAKDQEHAPEGPRGALNTRACAIRTRPPGEMRRPARHILVIHGCGLFSVLL